MNTTHKHVYFDEYKTWWPSEISKAQKSIGEEVIGFFSIDKQFVDRYLFETNELDVPYLADVRLKEGEKVFRYTTTAMIPFLTPYIKINLVKGIVYFLADAQADEAVFETRGAKVDYLRLLLQ